jgi:hypothetical protein
MCKPATMPEQRDSLSTRYGKTGDEVKVYFNSFDELHAKLTKLLETKQLVQKLKESGE